MNFNVANIVFRASVTTAQALTSTPQYASPMPQNPCWLQQSPTFRQSLLLSHDPSKRSRAILYAAEPHGNESANEMIWYSVVIDFIFSLLNCRWCFDHALS
jgi:hypothetical protein